jgi:NodT family efflux transporter outer membrane factor (OMF) lipoprotein
MRLPLLLGLVVCAAACRAPRTPAVTPAVSVPEAWSAGSDEDETVAAGHLRWWDGFGPPQLGALVDEALVGNRDLAASLARVEAAAAEARIAGADLLPSAGLAGNAGRTQNVFVGLPIPGGSDVLTSRATSYGVSLDVSWELDLWGRLAARRDAASQDLVATAEEHRGAALSVAAQTSKGWLAWREAELQREVAQRTVESFQRSTDVVRRRYETGRGTSLDLFRTQSLLAGAEANRARRDRSVESAVRQIELLLGRHPAGALETPADGEGDLPGPGPLPEAGLPAELLERRPDLRAARARLRATDLRLDEARAALLPRLTLTGSVGRTSSDLDDLSDDDFSVWSIAAGLLQPLYEGGRLRAGVDVAEARLRAAAEDYASALLGAFTEVETLLAVEAALLERTDGLARATRNANRASELAADRYATGLTDLNTLLDAQRTALEAESRYLEARRDHLEARVDLFVALGGGFE